jgi:hypothetical protein
MISSFKTVCAFRVVWRKRAVMGKRDMDRMMYSHHAQADVLWSALLGQIARLDNSYQVRYGPIWEEGERHDQR